MSDLPEVRRADCGHGFLPIDTPAAARQQNGQHEQPVYLCEDCRARLGERKVETKEIQVAAMKTVAHLPANPELLEDENPHTAGRAAAQFGAERRVPGGHHPRSAWARDWYAAYDAAKAEAQPEPSEG